MSDAADGTPAPRRPQWAAPGDRVVEWMSPTGKKHVVPPSIKEKLDTPWRGQTNLGGKGAKDILAFLDE